MAPYRRARSRTPPIFGPRPQTFSDLVNSSPSVATYLNINLDVIPIAQLGIKRKDCIMCKKRMSDEYHRPILSTPGESYTPDICSGPKITASLIQRNAMKNLLSLILSPIIGLTFPISTITPRRTYGTDLQLYHRGDDCTSRKSYKSPLLDSC
jgi:hypothetical protein